MLLADDGDDDDEDTIAIVGARSASRLRLASAVGGPSRRHGFPGRVEPGLVLGKYSILRCIARGGMASVWVARHRSARGLSKLVTLKTILPELAAEPAFEDMFLREARLASLIHHPNVCETFELIECDGVLALSMEWVDGASLSRMLAASPEPLDARVAARIAAQAAAGLHAAHELRDEEGRPMNLVHRDVSPQNILLSRDGHVRLSDFGIAKAMSGIRELSSIMRVQGKASYLSPEQARNQPLDRRSDVFSLGVVLYLAALGRRPFASAGERDDQGIARLLSGKLTHPLEVDPNFPPGLADIIVRALQHEPARRYATAADMRHDLELWLACSRVLISEEEVAGVLNARCGRAIEHQQLLLRAALSWDADTHPTDDGPRPSTAESGTFPSAPAREPPTTRLAPEPRPARLSWTARAVGAGAFGLSALVWLLPLHQHQSAGAPTPPRLVTGPASRVPSAPVPAGAGELPSPIIPVESGSPAVAVPPLPSGSKREPRARMATPPSPASSRQSRPNIGPVERDL